MSIRTTLTLEDDVAESPKAEQRVRGKSLRTVVNDLLRVALSAPQPQVAARRYKIKPFSLGFRPELNHDCVESLIEYGEGADHV